MVEEFLVSVDPIEIMDVFDARKKIEQMLESKNSLENPITGLVIAKGFEKYIDWACKKIVLTVALPNTKEQIDAKKIWPCRNNRLDRPPLISAIFFNKDKALITADVRYEIIQNYKGSWLEVLKKSGDYMIHLYKKFQYPLKIIPFNDFMKSA